MSDTLTEDDLLIIERVAQAQARDHFWYYRQYLHPGMMIGWWQREVASQLMRFYWEWRAGFRPKLVLQSPPQHGKSFQITDFVSWVCGRHPDVQAIYTSYADRLCKRANLTLQRTFDGKRFQDVFTRTRLSPPGKIGSRFLRNLDILEFVEGGGSFRNTTVLSGITGEGLHLGLIDDPLKGRMEANSPTIRDKTWNWFTDDFFTRFSEDAALLMIMTRWHVDDPVGRLQETFPGVRLLRYPALAEKDELHRKKGEPLFPELKSLQFLLERKSLLSQAGWESIYQQNPIIVGGGLFPIEKLRIIHARPARDMVRRSIRYFDKAGTEGGGAYTAGVLMEELKDGRMVVSDVRRGQWAALERETIILQTAALDNIDRVVEIWVEQEPGSGGKESAENTIRALRGFVVRADRVTGNKELRADPFAAQVQAGNVDLVAGHWNRDYINELELYPAGKYMDQVDASSGAFNKITGVWHGVAEFGTYGVSTRDGPRQYRS